MHSFDIMDGIGVRFQPATGTLHVGDAQQRKFIDGTPDRSITLPAETWFRVRITDDGESTAVYFTNLGDVKPRERLLVEVPCYDKATSHHIAFFNREFVGAVRHKCRVDNVVIRELR